MIIGPLSTASSDAYHRQDFVWIQRMIRKLIKVFGLVVLATLILCILAKKIITLWVGVEINPPMLLISSMGAFVLIFVWSGIFANVLNAAGKIKMQLYLSIFAMLTNIPLAILLVRYYGMGSSGVVLANCLCMLPFAMLGPIQLYSLLRKESHSVKTA